MRRRSFGVLGAAFLAAGCSALTSFDGLDSPAGGASDASSSADGPSSANGSKEGGVGSDGATTSDGGATNSDGGSGSDAGADANTGNLVDNPSFENGIGGCGVNWGNGYNQTAMRVSPGRTGSNACDVCATAGATGSYQIDAINTIDVQAGNYYAEVWLATPQGAAATSAGIQVHFTGDGGISGCTGDGTTYCQGSFVMGAAGGAYAASSTSFVLTGSGTLQLYLHSYGATASSCFLADDVAVYQQ